MTLSFRVSLYGCWPSCLLRCYGPHTTALTVKRTLFTSGWFGREEDRAGRISLVTLAITL